MKQQYEITDAEWEVMRALWSQGPLSSSEIRTILEQKHQWKATTVKTLLRRLVEKQLLETNQIGNKFIYSPLIQENNSVHQLVEELLSKVCSRKVCFVLEDIITHSDMTLSDIDHLKAILNQKKKTAVDEVICNCIPGQCTCRVEDE